MGGGCCYSCYKATFQNRHFRPPKIRGLKLGRTEEKFADSDANSESVTTLVMARYIVSYRISRYWGRIVAYLYRDNYPLNEVDIPHNSQSLSASMPSMPSPTSTKGVSCSVAGAGKVTLIGSNCPASRVNRCVDCEGGRTAQIFSDCAITKYLSRATTRWLPNRRAERPPNNSSCRESPQLLLFGGQYSQ